MRDLIKAALEVSDKDPLDAVQLVAKTTEELGEFSQAIMVEQGLLPHKTLDEPAYAEGADVILCVVAALKKNHPDLDDEQIIFLLELALHEKNKKYKVYLDKFHS